MQIDFDPTLITYEDLLAVFWASHRPTTAAHSRQYASIIFAHDDGQRASAEASKRDLESRIGTVHTDIVPFERFYLAEDYHQKYYLRSNRSFFAELSAAHPDPAAFRDSTAAARVNGYLDGHGTLDELESEIDSLGLSSAGQTMLRRTFGTAPVASCPDGVCAR